MSNKRFLFLYFIIFSFWGTRSLAQSFDYFLLASDKPTSSNFLLLVNQFVYKDINLSGSSSSSTASSSSSSDQFIYSPSLGVALGLRTHKVFMISLLYRQNTPNQRKSTGTGMRVYFPGFFLLGGSIYHLLSEFQTHRFHSFFESEVLVSSSVDSTSGLSTRYFENSSRIGVEMSMFKGFFIEATFGVATYKSNNTWVTSGGLGVRF